MSDRTYDILKQISLVWLPALATLYFALCKIWGFPFGSEVVATITAIDTFLGTVLGISSHFYNQEDYEDGCS